MADKKQPQWGIDRAYNMSIDNVERTKTLLSCIHGIELGLYSENEGLALAEKLGVISKADTYKRSTQTGLNAYGLLKSVFELSEASKAFIRGDISFSELMILQLYKKEYKHPNNTTSEIVRPLVVLLGVLYKLYEIDEELCWIDYYDYAKYLTEIKTYSEVDTVLADIIRDKKSSSLDRDLDYSVYDFDIWMSAFVGTELIIDVSEEGASMKAHKYTIDRNDILFAKFVWETRDKVASIEEYNKRTGTAAEQQHRKELFGSMSNGLFLAMPTIEYVEKVTLDNIEVDVEDFLYDTLVEGKSTHQIEVEILGTDHLKGWFTQTILETMGLKQSSVKGIFAPFKRHLHLLSLNKNYDADTREIIRILLEREDFEMEKYTYNQDRVSGGINKIYYGIPGCGKSYKISAMLGFKEGFQDDAKLMGITQTVAEENIFRTTFYLDYSNSDFVGQLMPKTERGKVYYKPVFGPFTKALKRACETSEMVYLIIEEINRGNAAAIFGDIFQLLDRYKEDMNGHKKGDSMYPITNDFIEDYLGIEKGRVIIPSNLTILATMNTSDQNVFPLDTAFKRRWDRERVVPNWNDEKIQDFVERYVPFTDIKWRKFAGIVNKALSEESKDGMILEDKQLGPFYVGKDVLTEKPGEQDETKLYGFVNNVVDYLYNDVTKFEHAILFEAFNGYDDLYDQIFTEEQKGLARGYAFGLKNFRAVHEEREQEMLESTEAGANNE